MALKFSESPAVTVREIDLTGVVPSVTSTTGAFVGDFNWGPVNTPVLVGTESCISGTILCKVSRRIRRQHRSRCM